MRYRKCDQRKTSHVTEDPSDLQHLTPSSFLKDIAESGVPDLDLIDAQYIIRRSCFRKSFMEKLRERFRSEYLSQLLHHIKNVAKKVVRSKLVKLFYWKTKIIRD